MKKLTVMIATMIMILIAIPAALAAAETVDMTHNTLDIFRNDVQYSFELYEAGYDNGSIYAIYNSVNTDDTIVIAFIDGLDATCYLAAEEYDTFGICWIEANGEAHYSSCGSYAVNDGYYSDICMTAVNENGWYQGIFIGYTASDDSSDSYEIVGAFDFIISGGYTGSQHISVESDYHTACYSCSGTGYCGFCTVGLCDGCNGMGHYSVFNYYDGYDYYDCTLCDGTGNCDYCYGTNICYSCGGTGLY